jgi:hypothetical protein
VRGGTGTLAGDRHRLPGTGPTQGQTPAGDRHPCRGQAPSAGDRPLSPGTNPRRGQAPVLRTGTHPGGQTPPSRDRPLPTGTDPSRRGQAPRRDRPIPPGTGPTQGQTPEWGQPPIQSKGHPLTVGGQAPAPRNADRNHSHLPRITTDYTEAHQ